MTVEGISFSDSYHINNAENSSWGKAIRWLRAPNEIDSIKSARKALAIGIAILLAVTIIGIIPMILGVVTWQQQAAQEQKPMVVEQPVPVAKPQEEVQPEPIPQAAGNADVDIEQLDSYRFAQVADEDILAKQAQVVHAQPKYNKVSLQDLKEKNLLPTNKLVMGEVTYYCSRVFKFRSNRTVVALVEIDGKCFPRFFYHSNSQGTWRVLPNASKVSSFMSLPATANNPIHQYGKGQCETDTQLPICLTRALNDMASSDMEPDFRAEKLIHTKYEGKKQNFLDQVNCRLEMRLDPEASEGFVKGGILTLNPPDPTTIHMPEEAGIRPEFSKIVKEYKQTVRAYGEVSVKIYESKDNSMLYMFYEMPDGRAFLASMEYIKDVPINDYGVRKEFINMKNMDAPLLEYDVQIPNDYMPGPNATKYGPLTRYYNNWNYVRELEIIKAYYSEQGRDLPEKV